jgi:DNA replication and repair protein RecF
VPIASFKAENFRCLKNVAFTADPEFNLIYGANASGKTSLLEALAYLGRGKSFRGAQTSSLVRHGEKEFLLVGKAVQGERLANVGVRNSSSGLEIRIDGSPGTGAAALAEVLPLQVIDPEVHDLVSGGPEQRRRFLDWMAFHVEPEFLTTWRRFRRALKQRNAALKAGQHLEAWTAEFVELGVQLDAARRRVLGRCLADLVAYSEALVGEPVGFEYRAGWSADSSLAEAVAESIERDVQQGSTQPGPQRADIALVCDHRQARRLVSRGQQKLLASSMILAATDIVQAHLERPMLLLLDDPAAELDAASLERLLSGAFGLGAQIIATSLDRDVLSFPRKPAVFHVERGILTAA